MFYSVGSIFVQINEFQCRIPPRQWIKHSGVVLEIVRGVGRTPKLKLWTYKTCKWDKNLVRLKSTLLKNSLDFQQVEDFDFPLTECWKPHCWSIPLIPLDTPAFSGYFFEPLKNQSQIRPRHSCRKLFVFVDFIFYMYLLSSRTDTVNLLKHLVARIGTLTPFLNFKNHPALGPSLYAHSAFLRAHFAKKFLPFLKQQSHSLMQDRLNKTNQKFFYVKMKKLHIRLRLVLCKALYSLSIFPTQIRIEAREASATRKTFGPL